MNEKETNFNSIFNKKGGLWNLGQNFDQSEILKIINIGNSTVNYVKIHYPLFPDVYINIINNNTLNASVSKFEGAYYLGINVGAFYLISDMFFKIFSTKNLCSNLGNVNFETNDEKKLNAIIENNDIAIDYNIENQEFPKDEMRFFYAQIYCNMAIEFLILHELGHILRGHIGYVASNSQNLMWDEYNSNIENKLNPLLSQTLEMDADSFATNHTFIIANLAISKLHQLDKYYNLIYKDFSCFYQHWGFAIYSFFRLKGFKSLNIQHAKLMSHPPSSIRLSIIMGNISTILLDREIKEIDCIMNELLHSSREAEKAFCAITYYNIYSYELFVETFSEESKNYIFDIINNWNNVHPLINPFRYGELPPLK